MDTRIPVARDGGMPHIPSLLFMLALIVFQLPPIPASVVIVHGRVFRTRCFTAHRP
jgi:hypothetical protein